MAHTHSSIGNKNEREPKKEREREKDEVEHRSTYVRTRTVYITVENAKTRRTRHTYRKTEDITTQHSHRSNRCESVMLSTDDRKWYIYVYKL